MGQTSDAYAVVSVWNTPLGVSRVSGRLHIPRDAAKHFGDHKHRQALGKDKEKDEGRERDDRDHHDDLGPEAVGCPAVHLYISVSTTRLHPRVGQ